MRHENGNCNPVGGFCTAVSTEICDAAYKAWDMGFYFCVNLLKGQQDESD